MKPRKDEMKPKCSVVIPLFNKAPHIKRTLDSILTQTIQDFEIIVVDDGSTDQGPNVVRRIHDKRISLIQQANAGVSAARNSGIREAKADLIAFLDADDEWRPQFLETILRLAREFPDAGAYATASDIYVVNKKMKHSPYRGIPTAPWEGIIPNYFFSARFGEIISSSSVAIPKMVFSEIGGFSVGQHFGEDRVMWGKIAFEHSIAFSTDRCAIIHRDATNRACQFFYCDQSPFVDFATRAIQNGQVREEMVPYLKEYMAQIQIQVARECLLFGKNRIKARRALETINDTVQFRWKRKIWYFLTLLPISITHVVWRFKRLCLGNQVKEKRSSSQPQSTRSNSHA